MIPGIILYLEDLKQFDGILTDADLGAVIRALMAYVETGEEVQNLSPVCELALRILKAKVDRDTKKYSAQLENGKKGGRPKKKKKLKQKRELKGTRAHRNRSALPRWIKSGDTLKSII